VQFIVLGPAFSVQLKPPVQPSLIGPVRLLFIQPGFRANALYPPEILQDREMGPPDGIQGELDDGGTGEIPALSAALQPLVRDATVVDGTDGAVRLCCASPALASTPMTDLV